MKHAQLLRAAVCTALALLLAFSGFALAESEGNLQQAELQLFTAGAIPLPRKTRSLVVSEFESYIVNQLQARKETIYVLNFAMQPEDFLLALSSVINDHPELFYVGSDLEISRGATTGNVYNFMPHYLYTGEDLDKRIAAFNATVDEIAAYATSSASTDIGRMLAVNDYFCVNYAYDKTLSIHSPDKLFTGGTGVCQAYMLGYAAVLDKLGITNTHATSYSQNHTWNLVELDGNWYHIDVTWNDSDYTPLIAAHNNFLLSDTAIAATGHYGWSSNYTATDSAYDAYFWRGINTPLAVAGDSVYFLGSDAPNGVRTLYRWTDGDTGTTPVYSFSIAEADGTYSFINTNSPICTDGKKLYIAACSDLLRMNPDGTGVERLPNASNFDYIWSCWYEKAAIRLLASSYSFETPKTSVFRLNGELIFPKATREIKANACAGTYAYGIVLPEGLRTIGERAFADMILLEQANIPASVTHIADNAFEGSARLTLTVVPGSYGEEYAMTRGIPYKAAD